MINPIVQMLFCSYVSAVRDLNKARQVGNDYWTKLPQMIEILSLWILKTILSLYTESARIDYQIFHLQCLNRAYSSGLYNKEEFASGTGREEQEGVT